MHVAATNPLAVRTDELDADVVAREKAIFADQARQSGKPEAIIEKMVEGRMRKFYEEVVLLKQAFVLNPDLTVEKALKDAEADDRRAGQDHHLRLLPRSAKASRRKSPISQLKSLRLPARNNSGNICSFLRKDRAPDDIPAPFVYPKAPFIKRRGSKHDGVGPFSTCPPQGIRRSPSR
jgi:hypothetical protein